MDKGFYLGMVAAVLTTSAFLPQVIKAHRSKHTHDLSLGMYLTFTTGVALWMIYGIMSGSWPVFLANAFTLILSGYVLYLKVKYG